MILPISELAVPISPNSLYGRSAPWEIEIGVGKGMFLCQRAGAFPDHNFLGIEKSQKWIVYASKRLAKRNIANVRIVQCHVEGFLERYISDACITAYHILFPDPWPKRRHAKRRLFGPSFLDQLLRTLVPFGEIHIATDCTTYFQEISQHFCALGSQRVTYQLVEPGPFMSNFQTKYENEGRPLFFATAKKNISM